MGAGWLCLLVLGACGEPREDVVAAIGDVELSVESFDRMAAILLSGPLRELRLEEEGARRALLQSMIDRQLLILEAENRGLAADSAIAAGLADYESRLLKKHLYETRAFREVTPTEEDLELVFYEEGYDEEVRFSHVMCATEAAAQRAIDELGHGRPFAEVVAAHSIHAPSARRGGDMGFVPLADMLAEVVDVVVALEVGQAHMHPVESRFGFHVFMLTGRRSVDLEAHRSAVVQRFEVRTHAEQIAAYLDSLTMAYELDCSPGGSAGDQGERLCAWRGGALGPPDLGEGLRSAGMRDPEGVRARAREAIALQEARALGLHLSPAVAGPVQSRRAELLVGRLEEEETGGLAISEEEMRAHFRAHPELYGDRPAVEIQEILVADADTARDLRRRLESGFDPDALEAEYNEREATRPQQGRMRLIDRENPLLGRLAPAALDGRPGKVYGPIAVPGGYSVFRVETVEQLPPRRFEEVEKTIAAILRVNQKNERLERFLEELRVRYADQVQVDDEVLARTLAQGRPAVAGG